MLSVAFTMYYGEVQGLKDALAPLAALGLGHGEIMFTGVFCTASPKKKALTIFLV